VGNAVAKEGAPDTLDSLLVAGAAVESRALPLFRFDPETSRAWWRRFDLSANPALTEDWSVHALSARKAGGAEGPVELALTLADLALLSPGWAADLLPLPGGTSPEGLVPIDEWLELPEEGRRERLPFVWGAEEDGELIPVVASRRLAQACGDRLAAWRTLQELAAVRSEASAEAARRAREEAEEAARRHCEELQETHRREIEALRRQSMEEAVGRLTAALFDLDPSTLVEAPTSPGLAPLLAGRSVEEVADALLAALDPETLESTELEGSNGNGRIAELGDQLLALVDSSALETKGE
jgi:hypothetical protein